MTQQTTFIINKNTNKATVRNQIDICIILINRAIKHHDTNREEELNNELENLCLLELEMISKNSKHKPYHMKQTTV